MSANGVRSDDRNFILTTFLYTFILGHEESRVYQFYAVVAVKPTNLEMGVVRLLCTRPNVVG